MRMPIRIACVFACAWSALGQEARISSRRLVKACAVLPAVSEPRGGDTARIQNALNLCAPGRAVVLRREEGHTRFESGPLILPREVTLFLDRGVTLAASRNLRDYDTSPGSCGAPLSGKAVACKPLIFSYQAAFSGVSGPGSIDGQADAWKAVPRGAAVPDLVAAYESQDFHLEGVTLRNAPGVHAAIYKTTSLIVSDLKIDSETGSGLLLSNVTGAVIADSWIHVPEDGMDVRPSILGPSTGIHIPSLHILGGRGISVGDDRYSGVSSVTIDVLHMSGASPGFAVLGDRSRITHNAIRGGCIEPAPPASIWELEKVATKDCSNPPLSAAPASELTVDAGDLPAPGVETRLTVTKDGSSPFRSIQQAIDALPVTGGEIAVKPGLYRERVAIRKPHVHLYGTDSDPAAAVVVYGYGPNYAGTFASGTLYVEADDVTIDHLTIENNAGVGRGQAVALAVTADRATFRHLRIKGAQDTLFAASRYCYGDYGPCVSARQYFEDCYIEGNTDFIFGDSLAVFERCELHGIRQGNVMYTAQSRHTAEQRDSAYVFDHCRLTGEARDGTVSLGRPWRPYSTVIFLHTQIDAPVIPTGWTEWPRFGVPSLPTVTYADFDSTGPGANPSARTPFARRLTPEEAAAWAPERILGGWKPFE